MGCLTVTCEELALIKFGNLEFFLDVKVFSIFFCTILKWPVRVRHLIGKKISVWFDPDQAFGEGLTSAGTPPPPSTCYSPVPVLILVKIAKVD